MIYPAFIRKGDTIGVTAPSLMVTEQTDRNRFDSAVSNLSKLGYRVLFTDHVFSEGPEKSQVDTRVSELVEVFTDRDVSFVSLAKGGYGESELIGHLDMDILRRNPKWMQGYSDNTVLLFKYTVECDIATIYGGNFGDYGMIPWHRSISDDLGLLSGDLRRLESYDYHELGFHDRDTGVETISDDQKTYWYTSTENCVMEGRMIGGCMDVLKWLMDTDSVDIRPFLEKYHDDSFIWFMETYQMTDEEISEFIGKMDEKGWLENVSGFLFGRPLTYPNEEYRGYLGKLLSRYGVPMVFDVDIGHLAPRMPIMNGAMARVSAVSGKGAVEYRFL